MQRKLVTAAWWVLHVLTIPQTCPSTYMSYILVKRRQVWEWCGKTEMKSRVFNLNRSSWYDADEVLRWDAARTLLIKLALPVLFLQPARGITFPLFVTWYFFAPSWKWWLLTSQVTVSQSHSLIFCFIVKPEPWVVLLPSLRSNLSTCLNAVKSERLEYSGPSNYFCDVWLQSHRAAGYKGNSAKWHAGKNSLEGFKVQFLKNNFQLNSFKVIRVWGDVFDRLKNMLLLLHDNL